jgi:hypothetical protein
MIVITLLLGEQIGGIIFPSNVIDNAIIEFYGLSYRTLVDVQIIHGLIEVNFGPIHCTLVVAQHLCGFGHFWKIEVGHSMSKILNGLGTLIGRLDLRLCDGP